MYPVSPATIESPKTTTPTIHVGARPWRQPAMKYWLHRCRAIVKKNAWTLQKWIELTNRPTELTCHQVGPKNTRMQPLAMIQISAAMAEAPNT